MWLAEQNNHIIVSELPGVGEKPFLARLHGLCDHAKSLEKRKTEAISSGEKWLIEYFSGGKPNKLPPIMPLGTEFQMLVWNTLLCIPYGKHSSYSKVAEKIGRPKAARAVGNACGANPLAPIIPCHRVLTSDGALGGYSGDLELKRKLLLHEGVKLTGAAQ